MCRWIGLGVFLFICWFISFIFLIKHFPQQALSGIPVFLLYTFPYVLLLECPFVCHGNLCHSVLYYTPNTHLLSKCRFLHSCFHTTKYLSFQLFSMVSDSLGSMIFVIAKLLEQPGYIQIQMLMISTSYMGEMGIFLFQTTQLIVQYFLVPYHDAGNIWKREIYLLVCLGFFVCF